jgi:hypothetical protein
MVQTSSSQSSEERPLSGDDEGTGSIAVACAICDAIFTFSSTAQDLQLSQGNLETLFMSVCRFCFRCRRPACPVCWDSLHGLCGACVDEVKLPFRARAAPLQGADSFPMRREDTPPPANSSSWALLCLRPGRFESVQNAESPAAPSSSDEEPCADPAPLMVPAQRADADNAHTTDGKSAQKALYYIPLVPLDAKKQAAEEELEELNPFVHFINLAEQLVTAIAFSTLLVCAVMIALAILSTSANQQIVQLLHVDIRAEIAYLTYLVRQLHW